MLTLQLGHPKIQQDSFPAFASVREAFLQLFRVQEESIYLFWHTIPLRFRYREELYHNFDSIIAMIWLIQRDAQGATTTGLVTQLLSIHWEIHWEGDRLAIHGAYTALDDLYAPYAHALNQRAEVHMAKEALLSEWKALLHQIIVSFQAGNIEIRDGTERRKWELLQRVEAAIPQYGRLYARQA